MQSSKPFAHIIDEPSETDLSVQFNVKELISFTFGPYGRNTVNMKMLQIVLHLLAHQLDMLEQVVDIKEADRAKAIEELKLQQKLFHHLGSDVSGTEQSTSSITVKEDFKYKSKDEKEKRSMKRKQTVYASTSKEIEGDEKEKKYDKSILDESEDEQIRRGKVVKNIYEKDSKKKELVHDTAVSGERKVRSEGKRTEKEVADDIISSDESDDNGEPSITKKKMGIIPKRRRQDHGTLDKTAYDEDYKDKKSVDKMATKTKRTQKVDNISNESEDDEPATDKKKSKMVMEAKKGQKTGNIQSDQEDTDKDEIKTARKKKSKTTTKLEKGRKTDNIQSDQEDTDNDDIRTVKKKKSKTTTKLEKGRQPADSITTLDKSEEVESDKPKERKQVMENVEKIRHTDDMTGLTDHDEPSIPKKDKKRIAKTSEKGKQVDETLLSDETEDDEETDSKEKRVKMSDKGRGTDATPMSDELEYEEEHKAKKMKKEMASKPGKRQRTDEMDRTPTSDEIEDDYDIKSKSSAGKKSGKGRQFDEAVVSEKVDKDEKNKTKISKVAKESKKGKNIEDTEPLNEIADYEDKADKKSKHKDTKKTKTTKASHDYSKLDESEDSDIHRESELGTKQEKVFKTHDTSEHIKSKKDKDNKKAITRDSDEETQSLNKPEDNEYEMDRQIKSKTDKVPHRPGKNIAGTKSDISNKRGKKLHGTVSGISRSSVSRHDSIQLATMSEFELLKSRVQKLQYQSGPVPMPTMPDNKTLKEDLAKGSVILPATIEAMQIQARVAAAEEGVHRMADLLSQLSDAGIFPPETCYLINQLQVEHGELSRLVIDSELAFGLTTDQDYKEETKKEKKKDKDKSTATSLKSVAVDTKSIASDKQRVDRPKALPPSALAKAAEFATQAKTPALARALTQDVLVTRNDMKEALKLLKEEMVKNMKTMTDKATESAERANMMAKAIGDKLNMALDINNRVDALNALSEDYAIQLKGFDSGLGTQLLSLHEQMKQMEIELKEGLALYDMSDKLESTGVSELKKGYTSMSILVHSIVTRHTTFVQRQADFTEELRKSIEFIEVLREQKADRDEVVDGLRDKVDITRLRGIPDEASFDTNRHDMQRRLDTCYCKFKKQGEVWATALKDLAELVKNKAETSALEELENYAEFEFNDLQKKLNNLEIAIGVPKAALMVRHISKRPDPSKVPEEKELVTEVKPQSHPTPSPASTPHEKPVEESPCMTELKTTVPSESRRHNCNRLVGGSHTRITEYTTHEEMRSHVPCEQRTARCYTGTGTDGRTYMLQEELYPCVECNEILLRTIERDPSGLEEPVLIEVGAGDQQPIEGEDDSKKV